MQGERSSDVGQPAIWRNIQILCIIGSGFHKSVLENTVIFECYAKWPFALHLMTFCPTSDDLLPYMNLFSSKTFINSGQSKTTFLHMSSKNWNFPKFLHFSFLILAFLSQLSHLLHSSLKLHLLHFLRILILLDSLHFF